MNVSGRNGRRHRSRLPRREYLRILAVHGIEGTHVGYASALWTLCGLRMGAARILRGRAQCVPPTCGTCRRARVAIEKVDGAENLYRKLRERRHREAVARRQLEVAA